jgi:hypothetical protein
LPFTFPHFSPPAFLLPPHAPPDTALPLAAIAFGGPYPPDSLRLVASSCLYQEPPAKPDTLTCRQRVKDDEAPAMLLGLGRGRPSI